ncbi:MAG: nuclear transport factor 2 family protein [Actinomycetota bacterium]
MADADQIRATIERYMAAMSAGDRDGWVGCFAADGTLEDPVGSDVLTGVEEIGTFFDNAHALADGIEMELTGPVRVAAGEAAFPFRIITTLGADRMVMPVIDVMSFDDDGSITSMRAFWDMADMTPFEG